MAPKQSMDLDKAVNPLDVVFLLEQAAYRFQDDASELSSAHQDESAGKPWQIVAEELDSCATKLHNALTKWTRGG